MKIFQDLYIHLNGFEISSFIELISQQCSEPWRRALEKEKETGLPLGIAYCFEYSGTPNLQKAGLTLFKKEHDIWHIPNIIPLESSQLNHDEYNNILNDFANSIIKPAIKGSTISITITEDQLFLESVVGEEAAKLLKAFSTLANKSTGGSHPLDKKRWFEFLYAVNNTDARLYSDLLAHTLLEQGWSDETADKLVREYEFAQDLLDYSKDK